MPNVSYLECSLCAQRFEANKIHNLCPCGGALLVRYHLDAVRETWSRELLAQSKPDLWRYWPVLPVNRRESVVSLGEGMTPLIETKRLGAAEIERVCLRQAFDMLGGYDVEAQPL